MEKYLPNEIIIYIYEILHQHLMISVLNELKERYKHFKWESHLVNRFKLYGEPRFPQTPSFIITLLTNRVINDLLE